MSFLIERDNGKGLAPSFYIEEILLSESGPKTWGTMEEATKYRRAELAQWRLDSLKPEDTGFGAIVVPYDETLLAVSNEKSAEVLSGPAPDTGDNTQ